MVTIAKFSRPNNTKFIATIKTTYREAKRFMKYFYRAYKIKLHMSIFEVDELRSI